MSKGQRRTVARRGIARTQKGVDKPLPPLPEAEVLRERIRDDERVAVWVSYMLHGSGNAGTIHRVSHETIRRIVGAVEADAALLARAAAAYDAIAERSAQARDRFSVAVYEEALRRLPSLTNRMVVDLASKMPASPGTVGAGSPVVAVPESLTVERPDTEAA